MGVLHSLCPSYLKNGQENLIERCASIAEQFIQPQVRVTETESFIVSGFAMF